MPFLGFACIQCGLDLLPDLRVLVQHELLGEVAPVALLDHAPPPVVPRILLTRNSAGWPRARTPPTTRAPSLYGAGHPPTPSPPPSDTSLAPRRPRSRRVR